MDERKLWPDWLKNLMPTWLQELNYPSPGVGDNEDLRFTLGIGAGGRWLGFVNPGWYYHENLEQYAYASRGVTYVAATSGTALSPLPGYTVSTATSGIVTNSISWRPSWGPILCYTYQGSASTNNYQPFTQHNNSFYPGVTLSWTLSGSLYWANLPASSILVGMRDLSQIPMGAVNATGQLISSKLFYYDYKANRVWVRPKQGNLPSCWADIVYLTPKLRFSEVVSKTASGVLPSYKNIDQIRCRRGDQIGAIIPYSSGGYITPNVTGLLNDDWVVLEYNIRNSFILPDHKTLLYYTNHASTGLHIQIYNELVLPDLVPPTRLKLPVETELNLNPIFADSFRSGFLFHALPGSAINNYWTPSRIKVELDKSETCLDFKETVKLTIYVWGDNELPLPYYPINVTLSPNASTLFKTSAGTGWVTDGRGELHALIAPERIAHTFGVTGMVGTLTDTATSQVTSFSSWMDKDRWQDGYPILVITNESRGDGSLKSYIGATQLDGIPRSATGTNKLRLQAARPSQFNFSNQNFQGEAEVNILQTAEVTGLGAWLEFGYIPQQDDELIAKTRLSQGSIYPGKPNNEV